jgi:hypothetical protein
MIFYFTGIENSKYAAKSIDNALTERIVPIDKALWGSQGEAVI